MHCNKNVIGSLDLQLRPVQNSQEILRMVPGLFIGQHAGGGKAEQNFLRGFDIDHGTDVQIHVMTYRKHGISRSWPGLCRSSFCHTRTGWQGGFQQRSLPGWKRQFYYSRMDNLKMKTRLDDNIVKAEIGNLIPIAYLKGKPSGASASWKTPLSVCSFGIQFSNGFLDTPQNS